MINWIENDRCHNRSLFDSDVIISVVNKKANEKKVVIKFRKSSFYKIVSNEMYMVVARDGAKIYFKESDCKRGFKLCDWTESVKYLKIDVNKLRLSKEDEGEYNLEYDSSLGLHYICLVRKLEKSLNWESK